MPVAREIVQSVVTLARLVRTEADKRARAHGMTRAQWLILINLQKQPGLLQKELAEVLDVEPITVARLVDRLEARGMVERRSDPMDKRCWRLHLTPEAEPLLGEIEAQLNDLAGFLTDGMDEPALHDMHINLATMRDRLTAELHRAPPAPTSNGDGED
jgi:DNA-binding MarR family transcriptional regulator